jgi:hypothetical protein
MCVRRGLDLPFCCINFYFMETYTKTQQQMFRERGVRGRGGGGMENKWRWGMELGGCV